MGRKAGKSGHKEYAANACSSDCVTDSHSFVRFFWATQENIAAAIADQILK